MKKIIFILIISIFSVINLFADGNKVLVEKSESAYFVFKSAVENMIFH